MRRMPRGNLQGLRIGPRGSKNIKELPKWIVFLFFSGMGTGSWMFMAESAESQSWQTLLATASSGEPSTWEQLGRKRSFVQWSLQGVGNHSHQFSVDLICWIFVSDQEVDEPWWTVEWPDPTWPSLRTWPVTRGWSTWHRLARPGTLPISWHRKDGMWHSWTCWTVLKSSLCTLRWWDHKSIAVRIARLTPVVAWLLWSLAISTRLVDIGCRSCI